MRLAILSIFCAMVIILSGTVTVSCKPEQSDTWIIERDMPQTRNLIPVLNRTVMVAAGPGAASNCTIALELPAVHLNQGPFWPRYGDKARMGLPVLVPEGFPCREPRVLGAPRIDKNERQGRLTWDNVQLQPGRGVAVHSDTWLGPPDMFHTTWGIAFGDIQVRSDYTVRRRAGNAVVVTCKLRVKNNYSAVVEALDFALFFPRALLDNETGQAVPLLDNFSFKATGFADQEPLDLLVCDGLGRGAWGPRCMVTRETLAEGEEFTCSLEITGTIPDREVLVVPLVSLVARTPARYWAPTQVHISPPGQVHYSDYTHFNLVVADSRMFRLDRQKVAVEPSSPVLRKFLGSGLPPTPK